MIKNFVFCGMQGAADAYVEFLTLLPRLDVAWRAAWRARGGLDALADDPRDEEYPDKNQYPALCAAAMGYELGSVLVSSLRVACCSRPCAQGSVAAPPPASLVPEPG